MNRAESDVLIDILREYNDRRLDDAQLSSNCLQIKLIFQLASAGIIRRPEFDAKKEYYALTEEEKKLHRHKAQTPSLIKLKKSLEKALEALDQTHPVIHEQLDFSCLSDSWCGFSAFDGENLNKIRPIIVKKEIITLMMSYLEAIKRLLHEESSLFTVGYESQSKKSFINAHLTGENSELTKATRLLENIYYGLTGKIGGRGTTGDEISDNDLIIFVDKIYRGLGFAKTKLGAESQIKKLREGGGKGRKKKNMEG